MNLVIHHLKKDMRYLRLLLVLWFALLLVNSLVIRSGLDRFITSGEGIEVLSAAYVLLYVLQQILQIVIVCQLVQGDALAGTTAFWLTRPISRKQLLLSKSLFVLLILLLPSLLAEVIVLWINGIPVSHMLSALAAETLLQNAIFLVPAVLVAALTPNLGRLVIVGSTSITVFFLIHYAIVAFVMSLVAGSRRLPSGSFPGQWPMIFPTNPSGLLFSVFLATGLGAMVIVYQYLTRTTANSARGAALGMFLVITTLNFWSWDLRAFNRGLPSRSGLSPASVKLVISRELRAATPMGHVGNVTILGGLEFQGVPPGFFFQITDLRATMLLPDGKVVSSSFNNPMVPFLNYSPPEKEFNTLNDRNDGRFGFRTPMLPLLSVDAGIFRQYKSTAGTYMAEVSLDVYQQLVATLPLEPGSPVKSDSGETTILNIVPHEGTFLTALSNSKRDGFVVTLRESGVRRWLRWPSLGGAPYVLRNRTRKEALFGRPYAKDIFGGFPALHRLVVTRNPIYFTTAGIENYQGPTIDEEWLRDAELLRVESRLVGHFSKSVRVDDFVMNWRKSP